MFYTRRIIGSKHSNDPIIRDRYFFNVIKLRALTALVYYCMKKSTNITTVEKNILLKNISSWKQLLIQEDVSI